MHPTGGSLRVFKRFVWLEVGSGKMSLSRPAHQPVTHTVGRLREYNNHMIKLWDTPFSKILLPSVTVQLNSGDALRHCQIIVSSPDSKWIVMFEKILGLRIYDESFDENQRFHIERDFDKGSAYIWTDSPWLSELGQGYIEYLKSFLQDNPSHYVLLGCDHNIEILAVGVPAIKMLNQ